MFKTTLLTALTTLALSSGVAHADNYPFSGPMGDHDATAYWVDVSDMGIGSVASAARLANTICTSLEQGKSEGQIIAAGAGGNQSKVDNVTFMVHAAEWHFCPDYY
jgi:hypothetical protein